MLSLVETKADAEIRRCLDENLSFSMIAGAGSGKTTSLIGALRYLREVKGDGFRRDDKNIVCITYTNRAVDVISGRMDWDDLILVTTLHKFLWDITKKFTPNIRNALKVKVIPEIIERKKKDDNGGESKKAIAAREKIKILESDIEKLDNVVAFDYNDTNFSDYPQGKLCHDDVISVASYLIADNEILRKIIGQKYPYIFIDEAQDTFENIVDALNKLCIGEGLPVVGYFGDPMQQIYDKRAGDFEGPEGSMRIHKEENFRCSFEVIELLNAFRKDIQQVPAGKNKDIVGSVLIRLVAAEEPEGERRKYSEEQVERASVRFDEALDSWGWKENDSIKQLFLVRQMIARKLGFPRLQKLFTGIYASSRAQDDYEKGAHFLLKPVIKSIFPLVKANVDHDLRQIIKILITSSPAFDPQGMNAERALDEMKNYAHELIEELSKLWNEGTLGEVLHFSEKNKLCDISDRLSEHLHRKKREEVYDSELHLNDKGDWLVDEFLSMPTVEIEPFVSFVNDNTPFSTQHGVKGEQYKDVVVVFDDTEAAWNNYSFTKMLTPDTSGRPTAGQYERSSKIAYVCFSRAEENLRILLFTPDPEAAQKELVNNKLFKDAQIVIAD